MKPTTRTILLAAIVALVTALALPSLAAAQSTAPNPFDRGPYGVSTMQDYVAGTVNIQEPNGSGGGMTGGSAAVTLQVRGAAYSPVGRSTPSPLILFVHGNHGSCDHGSAPTCSAFKKNERGYAYMADNLASWGYTVLSLSQDQLMAYQDGVARGMHNRRMLIAATLDAFHNANHAPVPDGPNSNLGSRFVGKLDFSRIGMMGHSRGGDVVTSYIDYNRTRPAPGRRYDIRGVIALAPTDFERRAPYGTPHLAIQPLCDGDVTPQHGSRMFERAQVVSPGDPFPKIQFAVNGANHNWFNTVWRTDSEDAATGTDAACTTPSTIATINADSSTGAPVYRDQDPGVAPASSTTIRLSGNAALGSYTRVGGPLGALDPNLRFSGDQSLMGDQQKIGFATMVTFLRRYVGGEAGFDPYMTGEEAAATGGGPQFAEEACPTSVVGMRISCDDRVLTNYYAGAGERLDVIGPDPDQPLASSSLGTAIQASGFANPFEAAGGVTPVPPTTATGLDWCNPEAAHYTPSASGFPTESAPFKSCPAAGGGIGQVNRNWGLQYAVAWENPVGVRGEPATLATRVPTADADVTKFKALTLAAGVNFFDSRNPARTAEALWNPSAVPQDFTIALVDRAGKEGAVAAGAARYGNALNQSISSTSGRMHVMMSEIRVPLADFAAQGVDLTAVAKIELRFGEAGKPQSGSIQLSDVGFQELATGPAVLAETPGASGPATGPARGVTPATFIEATPRVAETPDNPEPVGTDGALAPAFVSSLARAACKDVLAPTSKVTTKIAGRTALVLKGTAADAGCSGLKSVQVGIFKAVGGRKVRSVGADGKLSPKAVLTAQAKTLVAKGKAAWSLKVRRPATKGAYLVVVRAIDGAGNVHTAAPRRLRVR